MSAGTPAQLLAFRMGRLPARATRSRLVFEPLAPRAVPAGVQIPVFPCPRPDEPQPALEAQLRRVFDGRIRDPWIDKQPVTCYPRARLVKSVRASFMLDWSVRRPSMTSRAIPPTSGREPFARRFGEQAPDGVGEIAEAFGLGWILEPLAS